MSAPEQPQQQNAQLPDWASRFPFMFPGGTPENEEEEVSPPFHEDLADRDFFELYDVVFSHMKVGERIVEMLKRVPKDSPEMDEIAKYISELWIRGEIHIIEQSWAMIGINAGKISAIQEMKWDLLENGQETTNHTADELAKRARVLAAEDSLVRPSGSSEWVPVQKIDFNIIID